MTTKAQQKTAERDEARARLLEMPGALKPGATVYCLLRHRAASGMFRVIDLLIFEKGQPYTLGWNAAKAIERTYDRNREGIRVSGCGMDMGFELVYSLGYALWPDGFDCIGEGCPSNDHSNGDRDYTKHHHKSGGYALRHRWL